VAEVTLIERDPSLSQRLRHIIALRTGAVVTGYEGVIAALNDRVADKVSETDHVFVIDDDGELNQRGRELAEKLANHGGKVILISSSLLSWDLKVVFMGKPFSEDDLIKQIRNLMAAEKQ